MTVLLRRIGPLLALGVALALPAALRAQAELPDSAWYLAAVADDLIEYQHPDSSRRALSYYLEAAELYARSPGAGGAAANGEIRARNMAARAYLLGEIAQPDSALHQYRRAAELAARDDRYGYYGRFTLYEEFADVLERQREPDSAAVYRFRALALGQSGPPPADGPALLRKYSLARAWADSAEALEESDGPGGRVLALRTAAAAAMERVGAPHRARWLYGELADFWSRHSLEVVPAARDSTLRYYRKMIEMDRATGQRSSIPETLRTLALYHSGLGAYDSAVTYLHAAVAAAEPAKTAEIHLDAALRHEWLGEADSARAHLRDVVALNAPVFTQRALAELGRLDLQDGRVDSALAHLTRARDSWKADRGRNALGSDEIRTLTYLGEAYRRSGQLDVATEHLRRARKAMGTDRYYPIEYQLALVAWARGDQRGALELLSQEDEAGEWRTCYCTTGRYLALGFLLHRGARPDLARAVEFYERAAFRSSRERERALLELGSLVPREWARDFTGSWILAQLALEPDTQSAAIATLATSEYGRDPETLYRAYVAADTAGVRLARSLQIFFPEPYPRGWSHHRIAGEVLVGGVKRLDRPALVYRVVSDTLLTWTVLPEGGVRLHRRPLPPGLGASTAATLLPVDARARLAGRPAVLAALDPAMPTAPVADAIRQALGAAEVTADSSLARLLARASALALPAGQSTPAAAPRLAEARKAAGTPADSAKRLVDAARSATGADTPAHRVRLFSEALELYSSAGDRAMRSPVLEALGGAYLDVGRADSALAAYRTALAELDVGSTPESAAPMHLWIGFSHRVLGRPDSARAHYERALSLARAAAGRTAPGALELQHLRGWPVVDLLRESLLQLAGIRRDADPEAAAALFREARALPRDGRDHFRYQVVLRFGGSPVEHIKFRSLCQLLPARGWCTEQQQNGLAFVRGEVERHRFLGDVDAELEAMIRLARAYEAVGRADSALAVGRAGIDLAVLAGDTGFVERHRELAAAARAGRPRVAAEVGAARRVAELMDALAAVRNDPWSATSRADEALLLADIAEHFHRRLREPDLRRAVAYYDSAAAAARGAQAGVQADEHRVGVVERLAGIHEGWALAWLALDGEFDTQVAYMAALGAAEAGRARVLRSARSTAEQDDPLHRPEQEFTPIDSAIDQVPLSAAANWESNPAVLSYLLTSDTLVAWLKSPAHELRVARTAIPRDSVAALVARVRDGLGGGGTAHPLLERSGRSRRRTADSGAEALRALGAVLLPPALRAVLPDSGEIIVAAGGYLNELPFAVLSLGDGGPTLGERYALRYLPSLHMLADGVAVRETGLSAARESRGEDLLLDAWARRRAAADTTRAAERLRLQQARTAFKARALVVGDPAMPRVRDHSGRAIRLDPLPGAVGEADSIARLFGVRPLLREAATESTVRARLATASVLHLATHGYAYSEPGLARESFVALAPDPGADGLLTVAELLGDGVPRLAADLVVLSACQTGLGAPTQAEGTIGLQRAVLAKGARAMLVSLWNVSDESTTFLMQRFYHHWLDDARRVSKAEALRLAQNDTRERYRHPRYWAPFQLVGIE